MSSPRYADLCDECALDIDIAITLSINSEVLWEKATRGERCGRVASPSALIGVAAVPPATLPLAALDATSTFRL